MPNWVINYLTIKREDAKYVLNDDGNVDFNVLNKKSGITYARMERGRLFGKWRLDRRTVRYCV